LTSNTTSIGELSGTLAPSEPEALWTAKEAAGYLQVHHRTVIRKAKAGMIPSLRIGRCWRFVPEELRRWARAQSSNGVKLSPVPQAKGGTDAGRTPKRMD
jgi:excisionase family DNA binding protein